MNDSASVDSIEFHFEETLKTNLNPSRSKINFDCFNDNLTLIHDNTETVNPTTSFRLLLGFICSYRTFNRTC